MNIKNYIKVACFVALPLMAGFTSCQDKDYEEFPVQVQPISISDVQGEAAGYDYVISWKELGEGKHMQITRYANNTINEVTEAKGTQYVHKNIDSNVPNTYVLKVADENGNVSSGVVLNYTREGASRIAYIDLKQEDTANGYDMKIEWPKAEGASSVELTASNGSREIKENLPANQTSYVVRDVKVDEEWSVSLVAKNEKGLALPVASTLRIGSTLIGVLSAYPTPEDLIANGDDDEASAWLWTKAEYPNARYIYFGDIKSADDLKDVRVLFWLRDIETGRWEDVFEYPACVTEATPFVSEWYKNGGSLLLWSHAVPYIEKLGRLEEGTFTAPGSDFAIGTGVGGINNDTWPLAVGAWPGHRDFTLDFSTHPIYKGLETEWAFDNHVKLIKFKGPGWTEDHNCLFFNLPGKLTGKGNQDKACYDIVTSEYGIYPLGTWDGQHEWIGQLNVWEARQGKTDCKGTIICIGNGGCEFSMKNPDGTPDKSAYPKNNIYQDNVLGLAKNSLEYLKTR